MAEDLESRDESTEVPAVSEPPLAGATPPASASTSGIAQHIARWREFTATLVPTAPEYRPSPARRDRA